VFLSPTDERIAHALLRDFDKPIAEDELVQAVWPDDGHPAKLRVHVSRLRKRIAPVGLRITAIRNYGYRLHGGTSLRTRDRQEPVT
jgi:DNA-binding response OmpR family regulator